MNSGCPSYYDHEDEASHLRDHVITSWNICMLDSLVKRAFKMPSIVSRFKMAHDAIQKVSMRSNKYVGIDKSCGVFFEDGSKNIPMLEIWKTTGTQFFQYFEERKKITTAYIGRHI